MMHFGVIYLTFFACLQINTRSTGRDCQCLDYAITFVNKFSIWNSFLENDCSTSQSCRNTLDCLSCLEILPGAGWQLQEERNFSPNPKTKRRRRFRIESGRRGAGSTCTSFCSLLFLTNLSLFQLEKDLLSLWLLR